LGLAVPDGADPGGRRPASIWIAVVSERIVLSAARMVIGRGPDAGIGISDLGVSGVHAAISAGPPVMIEDLGSTNGTVIDGHAVTCAPLRDGSSIVLGITTLTFHDHWRPPADSRMSCGVTAFATLDGAGWPWEAPMGRRRSRQIGRRRGRPGFRGLGVMAPSAIPVDVVL